MKKIIFVLLLTIWSVIWVYGSEQAAIHFGGWQNKSVGKYFSKNANMSFGEKTGRTTSLLDYDDAMYDDNYTAGRKYKKCLGAAIAMTAVGSGLTVIGSLFLGVGIGYSYLLFGYLDMIYFAGLLASAIVFYVFALPAFIIMIPMWVLAARYKSISTVNESDGNRMSCAVRIRL